MSLVGALTPLGKVAGGKRQWLIDVSVYTFAGTITSTFVGATLGWLGNVSLPRGLNAAGLVISLAVAIIAIAREINWISFPLPQCSRQTRDIWARIFPSTVAAALWGVDLGLILTTYFTFAGIWLLVVIAFLTGEPSLGAALFATYWLGRAVSVWIAPLLMPDASTTPRLLDGIFGQFQLFRQIHVVALLWSVFVLILWLIAGT